MFYKVVYCLNTRYVSLDTRYVSFCALHGCVEYRTGTKTIPTILHSKLFVFDTLENARRFLDKECEDYTSNYKIFKCECENPIYNPTLGVGGSFEEVWLYFKNQTKCDEINLPNGTVFVDSVTLIEEVT